MSANWFVRFEDGKVPPTKAQVGSLLHNFFGGAARDIYWSTDRYYVTLRGYCTFPFAEIAPEVSNPFGDGEPKQERWIEVWLDKSDGTVNVMTRSSDEYTNALAERVAKMISRFRRGRLDADGDD